jgi:type IV pilus assembly protein PilC
MFGKKKEIKKEAKKKKNFSVNFGSSEERSYLIENLTMLLASGMNVSLALKAIKSEIKSKSLIFAIDSIEKDINNGSSLWRAFDSVNIFPGYVVSLMRIGEESGKLSQNLKIVSGQQEKEKIFKSKIRSAMMYPTLVVFLTVFIGIGIAWFILPKLAMVFSSLKLDLPIITQILIKLGIFLSEYGLYVIPAFVFLLFTIFYFVFSFSKTKFIGQAILLKTPIINKLVKQVEISRFGYILGTLLDAGMPIIKSLDSLGRATDFNKYSELYEKIKKGINNGNSFERIFSEDKNIKKLMPATVQQMIISAENSGNLSKSLLKIGKIYEGKIETTTKNLSVVLEPILLVIVWVGVVFVALAVILPIYSLIGGLNAGDSSTTSAPRPDPVEEVIVPEQGFIIGQEVENNTEDESQKLKIKNTGIGYLNVRDLPSKSGKLVQKVNPGDEYNYIKEEDGWYEITLEKESEKIIEDELIANEDTVEKNTGWVIGTYVEIIDELSSSNDIEADLEN